MVRPYLVSSAEFYRTVRAELKVGDQAVLDDFVESSGASAEVLGSWLRSRAAELLRSDLAAHLQALSVDSASDPSYFGALRRLHSSRLDNGVDLEQLALSFASSSPDAADAGDPPTKRSRA